MAASHVDANTPGAVSWSGAAMGWWVGGWWVVGGWVVGGGWVVVVMVVVGGWVGGGWGGGWGGGGAVSVSGAAVGCGGWREWKYLPFPKEADANVQAYPKTDILQQLSYSAQPKTVVVPNPNKVGIPTFRHLVTARHTCMACPPPSPLWCAHPYTSLIHPACPPPRCAPSFRATTSWPARTPISPSWVCSCPYPASTTGTGSWWRCASYPSSWCS